MLLNLNDWSSIPARAHGDSPWSYGEVHPHQDNPLPFYFPGCVNQCEDCMTVSRLNYPESLETINLFTTTFPTGAWKNEYYFGRRHTKWSVKVTAIMKYYIHSY